MSCHRRSPSSSTCQPSDLCLFDLREALLRKIGLSRRLSEFSLKLQRSHCWIGISLWYHKRQLFSRTTMSSNSTLQTHYPFQFRHSPNTSFGVRGLTLLGGAAFVSAPTGRAGNLRAAVPDEVPKAVGAPSRIAGRHKS